MADLENILNEFMNKACDYEAGLKVDLDKSFEEAVAKINRLITEARIDELKRISKFKGLEWPSTARATYIENRIEELS